MSALPTDAIQLPAGVAVTLTYCDRGENDSGAGNQTIGQLSNRTVSMEDLKNMELYYTHPREEDKSEDGSTQQRRSCKLYDLKHMLCAALPDLDPDQVEEAGVLVMREFSENVLGAGSTARMEAEVQQMHLDGKVDGSVFSKKHQHLPCKGIINKKARHNNVIADFEQSPDYAKGQGTVVPFRHYPTLRLMRGVASTWMQMDHPLVAEQNRYPDVYGTNRTKSKTEEPVSGIGWHGDEERSVVWGLRLGAASKGMPLKYQAYRDWKPIGPMVEMLIDPGDVYVMSEKAVGRDFKTHDRELITWRHAAGGPDSTYSSDPLEKWEAKQVAKERKRAREQ
jgi:hypothetical protein